MIAQGCSGYVAARHLPQMVGESSRTWVHSLQRDSINSWSDMRDSFIKYFTGVYPPATTVGYLRRCIQKDGETSRQWVRRWEATWNSINGVGHALEISIFEENCKDASLALKIKRSKWKIHTMPDLLKITYEHVDLGTAKRAPRGEPAGPALVASMRGREYPSPRRQYSISIGPKATVVEMINGPCILHSKGTRFLPTPLATASSFEKLRECRASAGGATMRKTKDRAGPKGPFIYLPMMTARMSSRAQVWLLLKRSQNRQNATPTPRK